MTIILFLTYAYWFISLMISIRVLKKSNSEEFRKISIKFFSYPLILSVLFLLITDPDIPSFVYISHSLTPITHVLLPSIIVMIAMLLIVWYGVKKGGAILFCFPTLFLRQGSDGVERFFDKQVDLWKIHKRFIGISTVISMAFIVVLFLIATVCLLSVVMR